jgi:flagellar biosynthetic protein FlhB
MSESAQDRNLPASEKKKRRARQDGQIPRSRDLGHFAALAVGGAMLMLTAAPLSGFLRQLLASALRFDRAAVIQPARMGEIFQTQLLQALIVIIPMGVLMGGVAIASAVLSGGWNMSFKTLSPDFTRFNPITGLGRMLNKQHLIDLLKMTALASVIGTVGYFFLKAQFQGLAGLLMVPLPQAVAKLGEVMAEGFGLILLVLGAWALIDVPLQRHLWLGRLKMTREEAKQEYKDAEGNGEVKAKIKQRMREMSRKRMLSAVPAADLVVMNPTHYAVALKIRDLARESKVPVLQAPPLARALYANVELDQEVPAALFAAVAQVLAWVYQLRSAPSMASAPPEVAVPPELDPLHGRPGSGAATP